MIDIIGRNGAGKSTLLRCLNGLDQQLAFAPAPVAAATWHFPAAPAKDLGVLGPELHVSDSRNDDPRLSLSDDEADENAEPRLRLYRAICARTRPISSAGFAPERVEVNVPRRHRDRRIRRAAEENKPIVGMQRRQLSTSSSAMPNRTPSDQSQRAFSLVNLAISSRIEIDNPPFLLQISFQMI